MTHYPVRLDREDDGITVTFPDVPEAISCGDDEAGALANARDALALAIGQRLRDRAAVPVPSKAAGDTPCVPLPALLALKAALWAEMHGQQVTTAEMARRLDAQPLQIRRLLDPDHASRVDLIDRALAALGRTADVSIHPIGANPAETPNTRPDLR